jgi:hypothetical protein
MLLVKYKNELRMEMAVARTFSDSKMGRAMVRNEHLIKIEQYRQELDTEMRNILNVQKQQKI